MIKPAQPSQRVLAHRLQLIGCASLVLALSACGGGGGNPGSVGSANPGSGTGSPTTPGNGTGTVVADPSMKVELVGITNGQLTGNQTATVRATLLDSAKAPVPNAKVTFTLDPKVVLAVRDPSSATVTAVTDANGVATIDVHAATVPLTAVGATVTAAGEITSGVSAGKTATAPVNFTIQAMSDSIGLPIQKSMSISVDSYNIEGLDTDGVVAEITVRLADQYGNKVTDGTAVNFITEGGAVGTPLHRGCTTVDGACKVKLNSQNFKPANGRVSFLAYVEGVENFIDMNGDGRYSCTNFVDPSGAVPAVYRPLIDTCVSGGEPFTDQGDPLLDAGVIGSTVGMTSFYSYDGIYHPANGDQPVPYKKSLYSAAGNGKWGLNYIWATEEITFSFGEANIKRQSCDADGSNCRDWTAADGAEFAIKKVVGSTCTIEPIKFRMFDFNNNPLPHKTRLSIVDAVTLSANVAAPEVESTSRIGGTIHTINIRPDASCAGSFTLAVESPLKRSKTFNFAFP